VTTLAATLCFILFVLWLVEKHRRHTGPVAAGLQSETTFTHAQEFELYHNALSLCSMKTRICLAELGIPYKSHSIDLIETGGYENIRPAFLKVNPAGTVPVLLHRGHPIYESHEQIRYAARHCPAGRPSLIPDEPGLRQEMETWIDRSSLSNDPLNHGDISAGNAIPGQTLPLFATMIEKIPWWKIVEGLLFHFDKRRPLLFIVLKVQGLNALRNVRPLAQLFAKSSRQLHAHMDAVEAKLRESGGPWILGTTFSLADISWLVIFERLVQADVLHVFAALAQRPACAAYWENIKNRPSYREAIRDHEHPVVVYGTQRIREAKAANSEMRQLLESA
jgi:glutathione S-transferase